MSSIRRRLTGTLCLAAALLLPAGGLAVYFTVRQVLLAQFDATLEAKAQALITAAEVDDDEFEIDLDVQRFAGFGSSADGDFFEVRLPGGEVLARSPSLQRRRLDLPVALAPGASWRGAVRIADGQPGRALGQHFALSEENERFSDLQLIVASDSTALEWTLRTLALVLLATGAAGLLITIFLFRLALRRGLRPLDALAAEVQNLRLDQPGLRLDTAPLPEELHGIGEKLNDLLERVETSLARERRFSSHAAHELRTPLAELKIMTELIGRWPDEATPARSTEMLGVIGDFEVLLEKLSLLSRSEAGAHPVQREAVDLRPSIENAVERQHRSSANRGIRIHTQIDPGHFQTDPVLWQTVLANLIGNAADHAPANSIVQLEASPRSLTVSNPAPDLAPSDLDFLFDRFWRKNTARAGEHHSGLGLSIVRACVALLGGACRAKLSPAGYLRIEVMWDEARSSPTTADKRSISTGPSHESGKFQNNPG